MGKTLHRRVIQIAAIQHHSQRVAEVGAGGEDVHLFEGPGFHGSRWLLVKG